MKLVHRQEGMTLLEVLASITITGFILTVIVMLTFQTQTGYISITERSHALDQARYLTQNITEEMRSHRIAIKFDDCLDSECADAAYDHLILRRADGPVMRYEYDSANETIFAEFTQESTTRVFELADNVSAASFTYDASSNRIMLDITFTLSNNTLSYDTSIYARSWDDDNSGN
jgi:type II secretory pathway pseudopilin PulG